jgi:hypothetical protein
MLDAIKEISEGETFIASFHFKVILVSKIGKLSVALNASPPG